MSIQHTIPERQALRWVGAPRKLCHSATHEIIYNDATRVLLLGLRDCHISKLRQSKLPTPEEVSDHHLLLMGDPGPVPTNIYNHGGFFRNIGEVRAAPSRACRSCLRVCV